MSDQLKNELAGVSESEYMTGIAQAGVRQNDPSLADEMIDALCRDFPGIAEGLVTVDVLAREVYGATNEEACLILQGAILAIMGLKEVIDMRQLNSMLPAPK